VRAIVTEPGYKLARDERGLTERQRQVLEMHRAGKPWAVMALELGISYSRVGQIVKLLKQRYGPDLLDEYRPPEKIETAVAWLMTNERGDESFVAAYEAPEDPPVFLVAKNVESAEALKPAAQKVADETGRHLRMAKFSVRSDGQAVYPQKKKTKEGAA
jgi:hypothetical protein